MWSYMLRRLLLAVPTVLAIVFLVAMMMRLVPGDTVAAQIAEAGGNLSAQQKAQFRHQLGVDRSPVAQFGSWLSHAVRGDLGKSLWSSRSVAASLRQSVPVTLELAVLALIISAAIAVPLAVLAAVFRSGPIDLIAQVVALLGLSVPSFFTATLVLVLGSKYLHWIPTIRYRPITSDPLGNLEQFIIPALILGFILSAAATRMLRSSLVEALHQDFVRTAKAKGLRPRQVVMRHALRNAFIPTVTVIGVQLGAVIGGSVVIESIFSLPGIGRLLLDAVGRRDYPVIQGCILIVAGLVVVINLWVDFTYALIDPRIHVR